MKTSKILLAVCLILFLGSHAASAGSFAEKFRSFVLGTEAEAYASRPQELSLDETSNRCMGCHDGTQAAHIRIKSAGTPYEIRGFQTTNHPVGMLYDESARMNPKTYKPRQLLDRNIRLEEGKVACVSCHRLKEDRSDQMVVAQLNGNNGGGCTASRELTVGPAITDLCISCHYTK